jgi:hypothetical protein
VNGHGVNRHFIPISVIKNGNGYYMLNMDTQNITNTSFNGTFSGKKIYYSCRNYNEQVGYNGCGADGVVQMFKIHKEYSKNPEELCKYIQQNIESGGNLLPPLPIFRLTENMQVNNDLIQRAPDEYLKKLEQQANKAKNISNGVLEKNQIGNNNIDLCIRDSKYKSKINFFLDENNKINIGKTENGKDISVTNISGRYQKYY